MVPVARRREREPGDRPRDPRRPTAYCALAASRDGIDAIDYAGQILGIGRGASSHVKPCGSALGPVVVGRDPRAERLGYRPSRSTACRRAGPSRRRRRVAPVRGLRLGPRSWMPSGRDSSGLRRHSWLTTYARLARASRFTTGALSPRHSRAFDQGAVLRACRCGSAHSHACIHGRAH
jgi:hypothetical protein